jgi:hypothetical protein
MSIFGWFDDTDNDYHQDGSYTERNNTTGSSTTYNSDGSIREYSTTEVPLFGPTHVDTYNSNGKMTNSQTKWSK